MNQELIDKLVALDIPTSVAQDQNDDPYTLLEKINYAIKLIIDSEKTEGSQVKVAGIFQKFIDFIEDPQTQLNDLHDYCNSLDSTKADLDIVAENTKAIARLGLDKQDKLSQVDLDNIAKINQLPTKAEVNSLSICPSDTIDNLGNIIPQPSTWVNNEYTWTNNSGHNGWFRTSFTDPNKNGVLISSKSITSTGVGGAKLIYLGLSIPVNKDGKVQLIADKSSTLTKIEFVHAKEV